MPNEYLMTENAVIVTGSQFWNEADGPRPQEDVDSFARALQVIREGIATMNANPGDIGELIEESMVCSPVTFAQLLMQHLPIDANERLHSDMKAYWMEVAHHMGPDWIAGLRKVAAFMDKVDQF